MSLKSQDLHYLSIDHETHDLIDRNFYYIENSKKILTQQPFLETPSIKLLSGTDVSPLISPSSHEMYSTIRTINSVYCQYSSYRIVLSIFISSQFSLLINEKERLSQKYLNEIEILLKYILTQPNFDEYPSNVVLSISILCFYGDNHCKCIAHNLVITPNDKNVDIFNPIFLKNIKQLFEQILEDKSCILYL